MTCKDGDQARELDQTRFQNRTGEVAEAGGSTQADPHVLCPIHPSWMRPTTRRGSCNAHWTSRQNRARTCRCSWNTCSPGRQGCSAAGRVGPKCTHGARARTLRRESWRGRPRRKNSWGENPAPSKQEGPQPGSWKGVATGRRPSCGLWNCLLRVGGLVVV